LEPSSISSGSVERAPRRRARGSPARSEEQAHPPRRRSAGRLPTALLSIGQTGAGLDLEQLDIEKAIALKLKRTTVMAFTGLATDPEEFEDVFLLLHYKLAK